MKKIVLRYGIYSGIAEFVFFFLTWLFIYITNVGHEVQGYISYVSLICPLLFIYFGIRFYRDNQNNGTVTFLKALQVGLLMIIIPAVAFGIIETVYVLYIDPTFYEKIMAYDIEQYRKTLSPEQFEAQLKLMHQELLMNKNPLYNFTMMFLTIASVGILITLISSLLLMRRTKKPISN